MLNVISTYRDILCVDINVNKRCVDHSTTRYSEYMKLSSKLETIISEKLCIHLHSDSLCPNPLQAEKWHIFFLFNSKFFTIHCTWIKPRYSGRLLNFDNAWGTGYWSLLATDKDRRYQTFSSWILPNHHLNQELPHILLFSKDSHRLERSTPLNNPNSRLNILQSSRVRTSLARLIKSNVHTRPTHLAPVLGVLCSIQRRQIQIQTSMPFSNGTGLQLGYSGFIPSQNNHDSSGVCIYVNCPRSPAYWGLNMKKIPQIGAPWWLTTPLHGLTLVQYLIYHLHILTSILCR